ncbi:hypothetical protein MKW94_028642 [Papaver nudicaule]|uniref:Uncharacterized protein n=1 Tax=Papaver nudicaule TaxID=74823 RepID=A0AA41SB80_PAPNU|nr:hypothetical protein [Papaver nudicaule]
MNGYNNNEEGNYSNFCNIHPTKFLVGVCPLCLKERLVILLATSSSKYKQSSRRRSTSRKSHHIYVLQKVSALGSFLRRSESSRRAQKLAANSTDTDDTPTSSQEEESFISIKFEEDGNASWVKDSKEYSKPHSSATAATEPEPLKANKIVHNVNTATTAEKMKKNKKKKMDSTNNNSRNITSIVEHHSGTTGSDGGAGMLRWRKRVGQVLFQLVRLKKSTMESSCQDSSNKGKSGNALKTRNKRSWIKPMTRKAREEDHPV